ncbi:MAG: phospholipase/Carboxylesterase, partial [Planctomycetaceae bacterium]|nr:phospholipase/Carboxylesterase [Planctomycetaceae bacterium]
MDFTVVSPRHWLNMRRQFLFVLLILFIGSNELWAQGGPKPPATKAEVKKKSEPKAKPQKIDADDPKPLEKDKGEEAKDKDAKDSEVKNKQAEKAEKIEAARSAAPIPSHGQGGRVGPFPNEQILVGRAKRAYRLTVPKSYRPDKAVPLVFAFHGLGDSKDLIPIYTALDQTAEKHGFILVYPNAANRMWPIVEVLAQQDFEFFDKLYADLTARYNIDLRRVYLTGMSNGAFF